MPSKLLAAEGHELTVFYANSNIAPNEEYARRLETLRAWASDCGLPVVEGTYDPDEWERTAGKIGDAALAEAAEGELREKQPGQDAGEVAPPQATAATTPSQACAAAPADELALAIDPARREARCRACYRLRFEEAARYAAEHGFACLSTTLSVSPYQYTDIIRQELERAAELAGITPVFRDFRPYYDEATLESRERGMYRQNYCGCRFSDAEAAAERAQRKQQRAAERAAREAAHAEERAAEAAARATRKAERAAYDAKQAKKRAILKALREKNG